MTMEHALAWAGPTLDLAALALCAAVLWRLGRDPGAGWAEREARMQAIFDDLRALVAQSEGLARDLDEKLAGRETRLKALLGEAQSALAEGGVEPGSARRAPRGEDRPPAPQVKAAVAPAASPAASAAADPRAAQATAAADAEEIAERIEELADGGTGVEEIARRVGVAPAEVRLVIGLKAARAARRRAAVAEGRAHA